MKINLILPDRILALGLFAVIVAVELIAVWLITRIP